MKCFETQQLKTTDRETNIRRLRFTNFESQAGINAIYTHTRLHSATKNEKKREKKMLTPNILRDYKFFIYSFAR